MYNMYEFLQDKDHYLILWRFEEEKWEEFDDFSLPFILPEFSLNFSSFS